MAKLRTIKKDISYLTGEVISNCYMAMYFQGEDSMGSLQGVIEKAVSMHNDLIERANHPAEKHNSRLVRKHYQSLRLEMMDKVDALFSELSSVCK